MSPVLKRGSLAQLSLLYRRWAVLLGAGVGLVRALETLRDSEPDENQAEGLARLLTAVESGHSLAGAMALPALEPLFTRTASALVAVGEETGRLTGAIERVADLLEKQLRVGRMLKAALTYPVVLVFCMAVVFVIFTCILGSKDSGLFSSLGDDLPWASRVLVATAGYLQSPLWMAGSLGYLALMVWLGRTVVRRDPVLQRRLDRWLLELPWLGGVVTKTVSSRMLRVIATAVEVGMPLARALHMARELCPNRFFLQRYDAAVVLFREGEELSESLEQCDVFPPLVTSMMRLGEETGKLDRSLNHLARIYEDDVENSVHTVTQLIEPLLLFVAGLMTGFLCVAALQPILQMANKL